VSRVGPRIADGEAGDHSQGAGTFCPNCLEQIPHRSCGGVHGRCRLCSHSKARMVGSGGRCFGTPAPGEPGGNSSKPGDNKKKKKSTDNYADAKLIVISSQEQGNTSEIMQSLSHEMGHAIYGERTNLSSNEAYVNSQLASEGAATLNNIRAEKWILAAGGPGIGIAGNPAYRPDYEIAY
jgi:hypothetical protein